ncbi:hypothetical protein [Pyxidicoccus trucidator]|uniref:hypothetical protein n=1 Tax=Pyxidicoccus trucidator TaxID=2709662 RepID=UPI0019678E44|nr:hypothetical protein [Pyxidicoccus trucidator]
MSTIRRVLSGISSSISRARLDVELEPVTPLTPREPLEPVAPVRRGFSDQSEFQAEVDDLDASLAAHAPSLAGTSGPSQGGAPPPQQLRVFSGESSFESSFESARPRYAQLLGTQLPSSLGAPGESSGGVGSLSAGRGRGGVSAPDMDDDLLSPDAAAWELQNLDTSTPTMVEPEDLLFMLDPPGSASSRAPVFELGLDDVFEDGPGAISGSGGAGTPGFAGVEATDDVPLDAAYDTTELPPEFLDPSVRPAGPDEFLADTSDLGSLIPEEPSLGDAALAGVLGPVIANPAAASVPVSAALASQGVEAVADTFEADLQAQPTVDLGAAASSEPPLASFDVDAAVAGEPSVVVASTALDVDASTPVEPREG